MADTRFKIGDIVRIKDYATIEAECDLSTLFPAWMGKPMEIYCGKEVKIESSSLDMRGYYYNLEGVPWMWAECLLESIDDEPEFSMSFGELVK